MSKFIPISQPSITQKEIDYVSDAIQSGWVSSLGKYIDMFEANFAEYCGTDFALTVSSGTTALHLALLAMGIGDGDEVIVPDFTFVATANAVRYTGANVVTVDIDQETLCLAPEAVRAVITQKTKAIIPVHVFGHPANMPELIKIADEHGVRVIEDAAEAHGAEVNSKRVGSLGDCGVFSFYGNKIMTSGEGGMITTDNKELYEKMKYLRDHAMSKDKRYWHTEIGYNYRMTNLQAALGVAQLERIDEIIEKKIDIFNWYQKELNGISKFRFNQSYDWAKNVYWMIRLEIDGYGEEERNALMDKLKERGVDSRPYFYPISDMPMYKDADTPVTHKIYQEGVNLPSYFDLTQDDVKFICDSLIELVN